MNLKPFSSHEFARALLSKKDRTMNAISLGKLHIIWNPVKTFAEPVPSSELIPNKDNAVRD